MYVLGMAATKPKAALANQQNALQNIKTKISILEQWVKNGIPYASGQDEENIKLPRGPSKIDYYPTSLRQFNFWERSKQCSTVAETLEDFSRNANDTLRRHPAYRKQIELLISQLKARALQQEKKERAPALAELRRQLRLAEIRNGVLEDELVNLRSLVRRLDAKVNRVQGQADADLEEVAKLLSELETEIAEVRRENAELTRSLKKIRTIRGI